MAVSKIWLGPEPNPWRQLQARTNPNPISNHNNPYCNQTNSNPTLVRL